MLESFLICPDKAGEIRANSSQLLGSGRQGGRRHRGESRYRVIGDRAGAIALYERILPLIAFEMQTLDFYIACDRKRP
jgi:hypothetical protein